VIYIYLCGGAAALSMVAAAIFLRYWRDTRDRFFTLWAVAFVLMAAQWSISALTGGWDTYPEVYLPRLGAFLVIIVAIVDKNRRGGGRRARDSRVSPNRRVRATARIGLARARRRGGRSRSP
jgi:hypothetical protein